MARPKQSDSDNPPTKRADWIGAEVLKAGEAHSLRSGKITFYVFRSSKDGTLFAVIDADDPARLPKVANAGEWIKFKVIPETGKPRIGFSEEEAKQDIAEKGFHLTKVKIATSESQTTGGRSKV